MQADACRGFSAHSGFWQDRSSDLLVHIRVALPEIVQYPLAVAEQRRIRAPSTGFRTKTPATAIVKPLATAAAATRTEQGAIHAADVVKPSHETRDTVCVAPSPAWQAAGFARDAGIGCGLKSLPVDDNCIFATQISNSLPGRRLLASCPRRSAAGWVAEWWEVVLSSFCISCTYGRLPAALFVLVVIPEPMNRAAGPPCANGELCRCQS